MKYKKCQCKAEILKSYRACDDCMMKHWPKHCQIANCTYPNRGGVIICRHHWSKYTSSPISGFNTWWEAQGDNE